MKPERAVKAAGVCLMAIALVLNPIFLAYLFTSDMVIEQGSMVLRIFLLEALLFMIGLLLLVYSEKIGRIRKRNVLLGIGALILIFLALEGGSRLYLCGLAPADVRSRLLLYGECGTTPMYSPHPYLSYHGTPNYTSLDGLNKHNSLGFRGEEITLPKPEGIFRIVILGGSSAYTERVRDYTRDWASQLQRELRELYGSDRIEVINGALGGWNSWETLVNLEFRVLDLEPDMVIIYQGTNDVHARMVEPGLYRGDNTGRRKYWEVPGSLIFQSALVRLVTGTNPHGGIEAFVGTGKTAAGVEDPGPDQNLGMTPLEALQANPPAYFERNLNSMVAIAGENGVDVLLSTWAYSNRFQDYASAPHYERGFSENNEVVKRVGESHGVPVYDFASEMPQDQEYWSDGRHVNEKGAELKAELFASFIKESDLIF